MSLLYVCNKQYIFRLFLTLAYQKIQNIQTANYSTELTEFVISSLLLLHSIFFHSFSVSGDGTVCAGFGFSQDSLYIISHTSYSEILSGNRWVGFFEPIARSFIVTSELLGSFFNFLDRLCDPLPLCCQARLFVQPGCHFFWGSVFIKGQKSFIIRLELVSERYLLVELLFYCFTLVCYLIVQLSQPLQVLVEDSKVCDLLRKVCIKLSLEGCCRCCLRNCLCFRFDSHLFSRLDIRHLFHHGPDSITEFYSRYARSFPSNFFD